MSVTKTSWARVNIEQVGRASSVVVDRRCPPSFSHVRLIFLQIQFDVITMRYYVDGWWRHVHEAFIATIPTDFSDKLFRAITVIAAESLAHVILTLSFING